VPHNLNKHRLLDKKAWSDVDGRGSCLNTRQTQILDLENWNMKSKEFKNFFENKMIEYIGAFNFMKFSLYRAGFHYP
jgi:hypothetical protein